MNESSSEEGIIIYVSYNIPLVIDTNMSVDFYAQNHHMSCIKVETQNVFVALHKS